MHKKKMFSVGIVAMFAVVAAFAMAGTASAAQFGNCLTPKSLGEGAGSTCGTAHVFKAFGLGEYEGVVTKKPALTAVSELETPAFASKLVCTGLSGQGIVVNGAKGISEQVLTFEKCKGEGPALAQCQNEIEAKKQKLNGTEKDIGSVKAEAISPTEQEISPTGFNVACTEGGTKTGGEITKEYGTVTGSITCTTLPPTKNYELHCAHAGGLIFGGQASFQTGYSETVEAFYPSGKVYQK
jgi:hypothetical protein